MFIKYFSPARSESNYCVRQVNLSSWASDAAAGQWYRESKAHKNIVKKYHNEEMTTFSSMLATLKSEKPIRWEVRCRGCFKIVLGPHAQNCPSCGESMSVMPYM